MTIPRRKVDFSALPSVNDQKKILRQKRQQFDAANLAKFEKWFNALDSNDNGLVSVDELAHVFLSSGIVKSKRNITEIFMSSDLDKSNELNFDEFVLAVKNAMNSGKLKFDKLDALVDSSNGLTTETILSQQRRNLLMHYVVTAAEMRQFEVDRVWDATQAKAASGFRAKKRSSYIDLGVIKRKDIKSLDTVSKTHQKHMKKAKDVVTTLRPIVRQTSRSLNEEKKPKLRQQLSTGSLQIIDDVINPSLRELMSKNSSNGYKQASLSRAQSDFSSESYPPLPDPPPPDFPFSTAPEPPDESSGWGGGTGKVRLAQSGVVVDSSRTKPVAKGGQLARPIRSKSKTAANAQAYRSKNFRLRPLPTSPISTTRAGGGLSDKPSEFYASKQNKYSTRRFELPK